MQSTQKGYAPNRALIRGGFEYVKTYETVPGVINYYQPVTLWAMTRERLELTFPRVEATVAVRR